MNIRLMLIKTRLGMYNWWKQYLSVLWIEIYPFKGVANNENRPPSFVTYIHSRSALSKCLNHYPNSLTIIRTWFNFLKSREWVEKQVKRCQVDACRGEKWPPIDSIFTLLFERFLSLKRAQKLLSPIYHVYKWLFLFFGIASQGKLILRCHGLTAIFSGALRWARERAR